ncbi:MAG: efflux RND transporter permease subunit [Gammaproteobacteria bacterium]|nr:efflux RND transporter permease subunit [Gammaproteobacteria bacterium]
MNAIISFLVNRELVVNLVSVLLIILGLWATFNINREAFPNVNLDQISVSAFYPGATPEEIERLVVTPIEQELKALSGIDKVTSVSFPGSTRITLELDPDASNRARLTSEVQLAIDRAKLPTDLPADPFVLEIDGAVFPVMQLSVSGPFDDLGLKRLSDQIEDDLLAVDGIARVTVQGTRKEELRITLDVKKMDKEHVSVSEVSALLSGWNINAPGGEINTPEGQKSVRIVGEFRNTKDIANLVIRSNEFGDGLKLKDIATISETLVKADKYYDVGGQPAVNMIVMKKADADIIRTVDKVRDYLGTIAEKYGAEVRVDTYQDMSRFTRMRLGVLTNNGIVGILLVLGALFLFLRPSVAVTTTWGLPIVFLTGLTVLWVSGVTLNMISMLGFIMVLGMLVDDAIIVGENITYHMEKGLKPRDAAIVGAYELIGPVTATVMTTIVAFLPMVFVSGLIGKFIVAIPIVVCTLLFFSWLESFLMLPAHVVTVSNPNKHPKERAWIKGLENFYAAVLHWALKLRWLTVIVSVVMLVASVGIAKKSSFQLFPAVGVEQYIVRVVAAPGTSLQAMRKIMQNIDKDVRQIVDKDTLESTLASVGQIQRDAGDPLTQIGSRYAQLRVMYTPAVSRPDHDALVDMKKVSAMLGEKYADLKITVEEIKPGPPTGRALEVEISGNDAAASERVAQRLIDIVQGVDGVISVESGLQPGDKEVHVVMNREMAAYTGVNLAVAASHVRAVVGGLVVSTTRRGSEEIDVTIRFPETENQLEVLKQIEIPNQRGGLVPLAKIAHFQEYEGFTTIRHKQGIRVVTVTANVNTEKLTSIEINKIVAEKKDQWIGDDGSKVSIQFGGEAEKNQESIRDLAFSFLFALIGIFFILAIQFNNMSYPFFVMLAIPFGAIGIVVSFYLHSIYWKPMPLSFFALMGMVALSGVVVNSSLVLLVFVQRAIEDGMHYVEALILAGRRRLRAVILTATTTVVGLLPTAYGWGGSDPFVAPMALALSSGLIFATVITLITVPASFAVGMDIKFFVLHKFKRKPLEERLAEQ